MESFYFTYFDYYVNMYLKRGDAINITTTRKVIRKEVIYKV